MGLELSAVDDENLEVGLWWARAYSTRVPDGEVESIHVGDMTARLTASEFEAAWARGWTDG